MTDPNQIQKRADLDTELIQAIQSGHIDRFPEIVERYERSLYNFGLKMCGEAQDAEDVVQDTFINVFKYIKGFRFETKFKNWLYRIATSTCVKKRRKSKYAPKRELSLDEFLPQDEASIETQVPIWAKVPLDHVLNDELSRTLKNAILELPEKYRVVLVLRDVEGFSTDESAQILNLTPSNIKVRLHRGRLFLREKLKTYYKED